MSITNEAFSSTPGTVLASWKRPEERIKNILRLEPGSFTFALIKPGNSVETVRGIYNLLDHHKVTAATEPGVLTPLDVRALYYEHVAKDFYKRNEDYLTSGESRMLLLFGEDIRRRWRDELMPTIRQTFGTNDLERRHLTVVHGSDSDLNALRECLWFFGRAGL